MRFYDAAGGEWWWAAAGFFKDLDGYWFSMKDCPELQHLSYVSLKGSSCELSFYSVVV